MILYIIMIVAAFLTWFLPLPGRVLAALINYFVPDLLPVVDEVIQTVGFMKTGNKVRKFVRDE